MPLPTKLVLKEQLKILIEKQSKIDPVKEDPIDSFADGLAQLILDTIKNADIIGITSTVTGTAGTIPVVGNAVQNTPSKLK